MLGDTREVSFISIKKRSAIAVYCNWCKSVHFSILIGLQLNPTKLQKRFFNITLMAIQKAILSFYLVSFSRYILLSESTTSMTVCLVSWRDTGCNFTKKHMFVICIKRSFEQYIDKHYARWANGCLTNCKCHFSKFHYRYSLKAALNPCQLRIGHTHFSPSVRWLKIWLFWVDSRIKTRKCRKF